MDHSLVPSPLHCLVASISRALARTTWAGTGSWGCWRTAQSLLGPRLAQPMSMRPPLPLALREGRHGHWRWIGLQELSRQGRRQLRHLQAPWIVRLGLNR